MEIIGLYFGKWHYTIEVITTFSVNVATIRAVNQIDRVYFEPAAFFSRYFSRMNPKLACSVWSQLAVYITSNCVIYILYNIGPAGGSEQEGHDIRKLQGTGRCHQDEDTTVSLQRWQGEIYDARCQYCDAMMMPG